MASTKLENLMLEAIPNFPWPVGPIAASNPWTIRPRSSCVSWGFSSIKA
eukprot:CAMPEP_0184326372 /NCGR_PEP_ID=MMETSP1049-20130417/142528_1 /TAXON_ID=77928 /ORGANISM="Proteomonas sulcata, Strain CCMP704" /LENGTH=48 /DNA_ID= /DNA_START= /DNA_END= /DNA_ORIENTATION=